MGGDYTVLEHTADVGIRARGETIEDVFSSATLGLLDILDALRPDGGDEVQIEVEAFDLGGLLVDWLGEVLYHHDVKDAVIARVEVDRVADGGARGRIWVRPRGSEALEGTAVKAITYHQLAVEEVAGGYEARVFFDV